MTGDVTFKTRKDIEPLAVLEHIYRGRDKQEIADRFDVSYENGRLKDVLRQLRADGLAEYRPGQGYVETVDGIRALEDAGRINNG